MNLLVLEGLSHRYGETQALTDIHLEVRQGEVFGLVGPDGAGKTTLIRIVGGLLQPTGGRVERHFQVAGGRREGLGSVGYLPQRFGLYRDLSVQENVDFFAQVYGLKNYQARRDHLLEQIGLAAFRSRLAEQLSGGMKQKLALCCSLIHQPALLLMDEPTTGVDPVSRREFWSIVFHLQREGLSVISSTPYMDEAEQFDRVALLDRGRILRMGSADEVRRSVPGSVLLVVVENPYRAREILRESGLSQEVELFGDSLHAVFPRRGEVSEGVSPSENTGGEGSEAVRDLLQSHGLEVRRLQWVDFSMEDVFLKVTQ